MKYTQEAYKRAQEELKRRRETAETVAWLHREEVLKKCPDLLVIEEHMKSAVVEATSLLGEDTDIEKAIKKLRKKNLQAQKEREELLKVAGFPKSYLEPQYECSLCEDKGYVDGRYCTCHLNALKRYACEELSRTSPSAGCTFENFDLSFYPLKKDSETGVKIRDWMKSVLNYCNNYAESFSLKSNNVHLCGRTGLGKTHLSLAIANAVTQKGYNVIYITAPNMLRSIEKEHFSRDSEDASQEFYLDCDLLIIDDLGTEFQTPFSDCALFNIINSRILSGKPVIVNSNLSADELEKKYGERLASRIGSYDLVTFRGSDIRQLKDNRKE